MCCKCCSVTQQKIWVFGLGALVFIFGIITVIFWPSFIREQIYKQLPLAEDSRTFDKWHITPIPIYIHMYLFNWTNPEQILNTAIKPHFERVGPYVFLEVMTKEDIIWHENKTVSYYGKRTWYFEPEMSGGSLEDLVTCPHLPSIAASNIVRDHPRPVKILFNRGLNNNGGALYQTHTANEWLFEGFYDEFLDYAMKLNNSMTGNIESNEFAWFLGRNGSKEADGLFTIHTGQGDLTQMGEIKFWNGLNHTGYYEDDCGRINGSASELWAPNRPLDELITVYVTDTCRILNLAPTAEKVTIQGIKGVKYETKPDTFDNGQRNAEMKCYCPKERQPDNCPASGATDMGACGDGAPLYLSHVHFMYADESYLATTTGMQPNYDTDNFFIIMEPKMGIPLQVNAAVQVSLLIQRDDDITILRGIPDFYAPLFVTSSKAVIDKELAKEVKFALNLPNLGRDIGIGFVSLGGILIIIGGVLTLTSNWYGPKQNNDCDNNNCDDNDNVPIDKL